MRFSRLAAVPLALAALATLSCSSSDSTGPATNLGLITCSAADAAVCPPAGLVLGFNGTAGSPTITPATSSTNISVSNSAYSVVGATSSTTNGYWFVVVDGTLRAWGIITVASGVYAADIPLFCGQQALVYRFDAGTLRSYWYAAATLTGCSTAAFRAQLTWVSDPTSDLDLHLVRPAGTMFGQNDCYYLNCVPPDTLDWGVAGATGNPVLDVDDTQGFGPENITITSGAQTGTYTVVVHDFDHTVGEIATVKIFFNDVERYRNTSVAMDGTTHLYWNVATVNIGSQTVVPVNTYSSTQPLAPGARPVAEPRSK
jgi:hypothetical protein